MRLPRSIEPPVGWHVGLLAVSLMLAAGCSSILSRSGAGDQPVPTQERSAETTAAQADNAPGANKGAASGGANRDSVGPASANGATALATRDIAQVSPQAAAEFERAVVAMRAGQTDVAERELKRLAAEHPMLLGPQLNLGLLFRKTGRLEDSAQALQSAAERHASSAPAWNELGVTLRMQGKFAEAMTAYERSIAADSAFAPAHRNLGVLLDLYLGDPERALTEIERYKELVGDDKTVDGWLAELRRRTGKSQPAAANEASVDSEAAATAGAEPSGSSVAPDPAAHEGTQGSEAAASTPATNEAVE